MKVDFELQAGAVRQKLLALPIGLKFLELLNQFQVLVRQTSVTVEMGVKLLDLRNRRASYSVFLQ